MVCLFSRLHNSCHTRDRNLDEFFCHENHTALPTISVKCKQSEMKANILDFLKQNLPENISTHAFDASSAFFSNGESWKINEVSRICRHGVFSIQVKIACSIRVCSFIQTSHVNNIRQFRHVTFAVFYTLLYQVTRKISINLSYET